MNAITEPLLGPIRRFLPATGGLDLSPIVLYFAVELIKRVLAYYVYPNVF
jgi:YggT family protein